MTVLLVATGYVSASGHYFFNQDLNRIFNHFDHYLNGIDNSINKRVGFNHSSNTWQYIDNKINAYIIQINLGDLNKDDVDIEVNRHRLSIISQNKTERKTGNQQRRYHSYHSSAFARSFTLPDDADVANISAGFEHSVLKITIPRLKITTPKARKIKIL